MDGCVEQSLNVYQGGGQVLHHVLFLKYTGWTMCSCAECLSCDLFQLIIIQLSMLSQNALFGGI